MLTAIYRRRPDALGEAISDDRPGEAAEANVAMPASTSDEANEVAALNLQALAAERARVLALSDQGVVDEEALHHVLRDLDLENARLAPTLQTRRIA